MGTRATEGGMLKLAFHLLFENLLCEGVCGGFGLVKDKYKLPIFILVGSN